MCQLRVRDLEERPYGLDGDLEGLGDLLLDQAPISKAKRLRVRFGQPMQDALAVHGWRL
jgi:hypothetical protein